jgi:hypothetical protein
MDHFKGSPCGKAHLGTFHIDDKGMIIFVNIYQIFMSFETERKAINDDTGSSYPLMEGNKALFLCRDFSV